MKVNGHKLDTGVERCYASHPPLKIGEFEIFGGSCITPIVKDADIYIGFDRSMDITARIFPWHEGIEIPFMVTDMNAPDKADYYEFTKLVEWTALQLSAGKKVHAGCIGGHGRTGMFFSALVKHMTGNEDATTYVRENYCQKAVESKAQIDYLFSEWGIKKVEGTKAHFTASGDWFKGGGRGKPYSVADLDKELEERYLGNSSGDMFGDSRKPPSRSNVLNHTTKPVKNAGPQVFEHNGKKIYSQKAYDATIAREERLAGKRGAAPTNLIDQSVDYSRGKTASRLPAGLKSNFTLDPEPCTFSIWGIDKHPNNPDTK